MPRVELRQLGRLFDSGSGLHPASLTIDDGESLVLLGPSGSGKTTLLRLVAGLESPDTGDLLFDDRSVVSMPPHLRHIAYVTQRPALYPDRTVRANLGFGLPKPERDARVLEAAERVRVTHLLDRRPQGLSAGEQQRVALGRLAARRASVWLLDEPFANLDPPLRGALSKELHLLRDRFRATMILVTHDPSEAMAFGQRFAVLDAGRLIQVGTPAEITTRPGNPFVAYCFQRSATLE